MKTRINFLDNLRTFLIFLVIVLHAGIIYEPILQDYWIVSDPDKINSLGLLRMYLDVFVMFIIFFISGYFISYSVKNKSSWQFIKSKFNRIMLPWIVGVFTMIPAYKAIFLYSRGMPQEEWYTYFHIFQRAGGNMGLFSDNPVQNWLWFLPVLFMFQLGYLALSKSGLLKIRFSLRTAVVLTLITGVTYSVIISNLGFRGWYHSPFLHFQRERLLVYFLVFLTGTLCNKLNVFASDKKDKKTYILANVVLTVSLWIFTAVALNLFFNMIEPGRDYYFVSGFIDGILYHLTLLTSMFGFLYILIYVFRFNFNRINGIMAELNKNSYSVYIIHMAVIGLIATAIINLPVPAIVKFLLTTFAGFVLSNLFVSGYRILFKGTLAKPVFRRATIAGAILLVTMVYASQNRNPETGESALVDPITQPPEKSIHAAAVDGDVETIRQHIAAGTNLDSAEPSGGSSPLITAAVFGQIEVALLLIDAGADINFRNNEGSTPLHTAAFFCRTEIVKALLAKGADKSLKNNSGSTPLESVNAPYEFVEPYYEHFEKTLGPLGLNIDMEEIRKARPLIAEILENE